MPMVMLMIENKFSKDTISAMRSTFKTDGWQSEPRLSESWLWKRSGKNTIFLSPRGAPLNFRGQAISYISSNENSPRDIIIY